MSVTATQIVTALFVDRKGPYFGRDDVSPWDERANAFGYTGPFPVVAHPPCGRWCRLAKLVEARYPHLKVGADGGAFAFALYCVRQFGGVLEHPAWSMSWGVHQLISPDVGGWTRVMGDVQTGGSGWVCEVNQAAYGHAATKCTWLYYVGKYRPTPMIWARTRGTHVVGHMDRRGDGTKVDLGKRRLGEHKSHLTPAAFADALIDLARHCGGAP